MISKILSLKIIKKLKIQDFQKNIHEKKYHEQKPLFYILHLFSKFQNPRFSNETFFQSRFGPLYIT